MDAAVASGTSSVMGAPFGALLFSIEVTASFYLVRCVSGVSFLTVPGSRVVLMVVNVTV